MAYSAELYVHDLDRQAADALNQFPKFVKLLESYSVNYDEKAAKIDLLSTAIRLGENQMPEVYSLLPRSVSSLALIPRSFIMCETSGPMQQHLAAFTLASM